ncbi:hypothetical protein [Benzoatithermus flavus]|uniref:Uncharacterized protein n=1 Tax=Benzoatithermus flavus TaxID=3108223 RepID=A0ABU8XMZ8_9PROT
MRRYEPPQQGRAGQLFDTVFLVILVYLSLFTPLILGLTGGGTKVAEVAEKSWTALGQNAVMQAQWEKLGYTAETAAEIITKRFDYGINVVALIATAAIIIGYFWFVLSFSEKEYREVIAEKFGETGRR